MRHKQQWLPPLAVVLLCLVAHTAMAAPRLVGTVQTASGRLTVRRQGAAVLSALPARSFLYVGDVVTTGVNAKATLLFTDGAQIRLNASTSIQITAPVEVGRGKQSLFRIISGEVWARLRPGQAVQTRTAIAGVRGTEINLSVAEDGTTTLTVTEGEVDFFNQFGEAIVGQSQRSVARPGAAPTAPVTIQNAELAIEWTLDLNRALIPREKFFISLDRRVVSAQLPRRAELARRQPAAAEAQISYGDALFDTGQFTEALREYQEADRLEHQPATLNRLGNTLLELDRLDDAERSFRAALGSSGGNTPLQPIALTLSTAIAAGGPDTVPSAANQQAQALAGLAWVELTRNRPAAAQVVAEQAVAADDGTAIHPTALSVDVAEAAAPQANVETYVALGLALMRQPGKLDTAAQTFKTALTAEPAVYRYQARAWLALVYLAQDDQSAALKEALAAAQMAPQSGLAHGNLALVYFFSGRPREAAREARLAVNLNPKSVAARVALGQASLAQGDVDMAANAAAQAIALDPSLPQARYLLGVADAGQRDYSHAARELKESIRLEPNFLPAVSALARVYTNMGRKDEAVQLLTELLPRHRDADEVRAALGAVYYQQAEYTKAAMQYREALLHQPRSALYHAELARTLIDGNQLDAAINAAHAAVRLAPEVGQYHATLGLAYEYSGLVSRAEREFREALTRDPQNALARVRLAFLSSGADLRPAQAGFTQPLLAPRADLLRPAEASLTQAFLIAPAVSSQLLRGGVNTEITPRSGNEGQRNLNLNYQIAGAEGKLHSLGVYGRNEDNGTRSNDDSDGLDFSQYTTFVPNSRTNLYFNLLGGRATRGLAGAASEPDLDDRSAFRVGRAQVAMRRRIGNGNYLWLGLFGNTTRNTITDRGLNSFRDEQTGLPVESEKVTTGALQPEVRLDFAVGNTSTRPGILTFGLSTAGTDFDTTRDLLFPLPDSAATGVFHQDDRTLMAYAQLDQRVSKRFSFIAQLRGQRVRERQSAQVTIPDQPLFSFDGSHTKSHLLPSLLTTYQVDRQTALRFSFNNRVTDVTTSTFAPIETLLSTETSTLPFGTPDKMRLLQLDVERYVGGRGFLKLFLFHTAADNVQIGGQHLFGFGGELPAPAAPALLVGEWRGAGAGLRYEHQLSRSFFANLSLVARHTTNTTHGEVFDTIFSGQTAPYEPKRLASFELHHVGASGNKVGLRVRHVGSFFQDSPLVVGRPLFPAQTYVDLLLAMEPSVSNEFFLNVTNVFNRSQIQFNNFPMGQRRLQFGVTRRF